MSGPDSGEGEEVRLGGSSNIASLSILSLRDLVAALRAEVRLFSAGVLVSAGTGPPSMMLLMCGRLVPSATGLTRGLQSSGVNGILNTWLKSLLGVVIMQTLGFIFPSKTGAN